MNETITRRTFTKTGAATTLGLLGSVRTTDAAESGWRVGLARVCITPAEPIWLQGYAAKVRYRPFDGKLSDLHAKAMALEDRDGNRAVLITADLCILRRKESDEVFADLMQATGLERRQILVNLSHTHSGPIIGRSDLRRFPMPEADQKRTIRYTEILKRKLVKVAADALADLKPARLSYDVGKADFVMNRRLYDENGNYRGMGPNPDKYVDRTVPVLRVDSPDGTLRALLFGCACHAVTLTGKNLKVCGDYPSFAQQGIEDRHRGCQAMFATGFAGDANTHPRGTVEMARKQGRSLADEVCRVARGKLQPVRGPLRCERATVDLPLQQPPRKQLEQWAKGPSYMAHNAKPLLDLLNRKKPLPARCSIPIAVWQFGQDLTLVALSGEVVSDFVPLLRKAIGPDRLWLAGYTNRVFGYLPSARIVREGGYEARGLITDLGFFSEKAEPRVVAAVKQLAHKAGRRLP